MRQTSWHQRWLWGRKYEPSTSAGLDKEGPPHWLEADLAVCLQREEHKASLSSLGKASGLRRQCQCTDVYCTDTLGAINLALQCICLVYSWFKCISSTTWVDYRLLCGKDVFHFTFLSQARCSKKMEATLGISYKAEPVKESKRAVGRAKERK